MSLKKINLLALIVFTSLIGYAQLDGDKQSETWMKDNIFLDGEITDYYTGNSISGVNITASAGGATIAKGTSDGKGEYKLVLEYDKIYTITFSKAGFTNKTITMNTNGVPDLKRQKVPDMGAEITLFKPNDCIKTDLLDLPIGKAIYFPKKNIMDWDMEYSMPRLEKLNKLLEKCAKEAERKAAEEAQKEKDYALAMKAADKAFSKDNFDEAVVAYKKAIKLFDDRPEPKSKLKLIETELAKKLEVEKQRAEEKARAEAEAIAKAAEEEAAQKAEEERIAKEAAEAKALLKAAAELAAQKEAETAAQKAEEERVAKEQAKIEAEIASKKAAEEKARELEKQALKKAETENKAKLLAQQEAKKRKEAETKALAEKEAARLQKEKERKAKEIAANLALETEKARAKNQVQLKNVQKEVIVEVKRQEKEEEQTFYKTSSATGTKESPPSNGIKFKSKGKNKNRHLYQRPNKHKKGKGPQPKKRIVF